MNPTPELLKTPFDEVYLPSMGLFYSAGTPTIKVRELNAYDEILLSSPSLVYYGNAMKMLFNNVVLSDVLNYDDLLICDKNAILLFLRSTTYGDDVEMNFVCPECQTEEVGKFKISSIEAKEMSVLPDENGQYEFILPSTRKTETPVSIKFVPLRVNQQEIIKSGELIPRLLTQITSINGNQDKSFILSTIKKIKIKDSQALRLYIDKVEPGFDEMVMHVCTNCEHEIRDVVRIDDTFMTLPPEYRKTVNEEIFLSYYYGNGISRADAFTMTVNDRRWTIQRISEEIEKKNKAEKDAMDKAKSRSKR